MSFDPSGAISYGWYDFTVPFEVDVLNGVFDKAGNKLTYNVDYAVMEFSEEKRATNTGRPWIWFKGTLQPSKLYTITLDDAKNWNTFLFKKKAGSSVLGNKTYAASCSNSGETTDRGWNGLGNGTLQYRQLNTLPANTKIQVNDNVQKCYVQKVASAYTYAVGTAFFVQVAEATNINLTSVSTNRAFLAPGRDARTIEEFYLTLTDSETDKTNDRLWVSASEEATGEYVIGHDLLKMGTPTQAKVAQMWTTRNNMQLCDAEMQLVGTKASAPLTVFAPEAGAYELEVEEAPAEMSPYTMDLSKGTTDGYGLRIIADRQTTTDIENGEAAEGENGVRKVLIDNVLYLITPDGKMYDVIGKGVKF